jgi:hypothetical protein
MFYIRFFKNDNQNRTQYVSLPTELRGYSSYYQIYENGRPLSGFWHADLKSARKALKMLPNELERLSNGWYRIEIRNTRLAMIRNILGIRKVYDDGTVETMTYVIRKIDVASGYAKY